MLQDPWILKRRERFAPNVCHNPVGVDPDLSSFTQGRLADSPTLGFEAQSLWDCQNGRAFEWQDTCRVQDMSLQSRDAKMVAESRATPMNRKAMLV
jgi:hypothetical protein